MMERKRIYGVLGEFSDAEALLTTTRTVRRSGYRRFEAYTPYPVHGLAEAVGFRWNGVGVFALAGGIIGFIGGFFLQWYPSVIDYPWNIGGRPLNSWPAFIPITFELTVLFAAVFTAIGLFWLNGYPRPYHPLFNNDRFHWQSRDRFFLCIEADDPRFSVSEVSELLKEQGAVSVTEVLK